MDDLVRRGDHVTVPRVVRAQVDVPVGVDAAHELERRSVRRLEVLFEEDAELEDRDGLRLRAEDDRRAVGRLVLCPGLDLYVLGEGVEADVGPVGDRLDVRASRFVDPEALVIDAVQSRRVNVEQILVGQVAVVQPAFQLDQAGLGARLGSVKHPSVLVIASRHAHGAQ